MPQPTPHKTKTTWMMEYLTNIKNILVDLINLDIIIDGFDQNNKEYSKVGLT